MDDDRAWHIFALVVLLIAVTLAMVAKVRTKPPAFVWPVAWCWKDGELGMPCKHVPRQQDI